MNILRLISFLKVQHIILYSFQRLLLCNYLHKSMLYYTFYLVASGFLAIFAQKFIMSYYEAERYNEAASGNAIPDTTRPR